MGPLRWPWRRASPVGSRPRVVPRALTLGAYLDATVAAGVDDGEPWNARTASPDVCLAVLDALCEDVTLPDGDPVAVVREQAGVQWARMEAVRDRAQAVAERVRQAVEEAVGEGLVPGPPPGSYALVRALSTLSPVERAAALAEPLSRALVLNSAGAVVRQADEAREKALKTAQIHLN